jgi:murein DD-endopeptidase MepM/ murein hydrolase activator NlpD
MWISESTGRIKKIPVTLKTILMAIVSAALFFLILGAVMNFIGFRIAIQQTPEMVRAVGGVITANELEEITSGYRSKLEKLNGQQSDMATELAGLIEEKNKFANLVTPKVVRNHVNSGSKDMGGPHVSLKSSSANVDLHEAIDEAIDGVSSFRKNIMEIRADWEKQLAWIDTLPSGVPIEGQYRLASGYGPRSDPFTSQLARHEGLDFAAEAGSIIVASGHGKVSKTGFHNDYGNFVEITHKGGYKTKYAHASAILVETGQEVRRGDPIAKVGSTGRSTGPHLHYEVMKDGGFFRSDTKIDPAGMLVRN